MAEEAVPVDTALFTTLSTTTRLVTFSKKKFLLTDTVGFIDRLPLTLMEAFRSTLEETIFSDLILLMVDASETDYVIEKKLSTCLETIEHIGAAGIPTITVLNKIDLISEEEIRRKMGSLKDKVTTLVPISALDGTNVEELKKEIVKELGNYVRASFTVPVTKDIMSFMAWLFKNADVQTADYGADSVRVVFEADPSFAERVRNRVEKEFNSKLERA
jgi:GTP-binding protein HflX